MGLFERLEDWAAQEIAEVKKAPVALGIAFVLGGAAGSWVANLFYAERIEVLKTRLEGSSATPSPIATPTHPPSPAAATFALLFSRFVKVGGRPVETRPFRF